MKKINEVLKKHDLKPYRYDKKGETYITYTKNGIYVIKKNNSNEEIFNYLKTRNFNYFPKVIESDELEVMEYIENYNIPDEQKILDLINLVGLLHSKTTHYKEIDFEDYKKIYEDIINNIEYLNSYYTDIITLIESHVYMSPSDYLLARNISHIFGALNFCTEEVEKWYKLIKDKTKQRTVVLHNNLDLTHFIENEKPYLINWKKSKIGIPIFDLYILFKRHILDFDFTEVFNSYENIYPLHEDEKKLFFILISLPSKIEFDNNEYELTKKISRELDILYKTERFISPYYSKQSI